jgi:putative tricarboxylic transport membrane protein
MEALNHLLLSLKIALDPINLFLCFCGGLIGTFVGVLPGLGPAASMSLLLPLTFTLNPVQALIFLSGIYYGAMYGGSTTSILVNIPGEAASVVTCLDGYQMAQKGRAGPALGIAAIGSFVAGTFSVVMLMLLGPPISEIAIKFGPPEFVSLSFLGLTLVTYLASGSMIKALIMACVGLLLGFIGVDIVTGVERFTLGISVLLDGVGLVPVVMGLFGISEVMLNLEQAYERAEISSQKIQNIWPNRKDLKDSAGAITRGSILGFFLGVIPGGGALLASFMSYAVEKKVSREPETFGRGNIRGVAGPESANNAGAGGAFVPLLTLGIPCNVIMALLMGGLMIHGVEPGPRLIAGHPEVFWGVVGSMYLGNGMLLVINLPLIGIWVKILKLRYSLLFPLILFFCLIGAYTTGNTVYDIYVMMVFGVAGYLMKKFGYEPAPLVLALVLGPIMERAFRQSLIISSGSPWIFISRPISAVFVFAAILILVSPVILRLLGKSRLMQISQEKK